MEELQNRTCGSHLGEYEEVEGGGVHLEMPPLVVANHRSSRLDAEHGVDGVVRAFRDLESLDLVLLMHHASKKTSHQLHRTLENKTSGIRLYSPMLLRSASIAAAQPNPDGEP